jgi:hypothetical protein
LWETLQPNHETLHEPLEVLAYRGPLTRDLAKLLGWNTTDTFGDPGILLSKVFEPEPKRWEVGFVPNFAHAHIYRGTESATGIKVIDLERPDVRAVTAELSSCRAIVSTSLHGIVAAQAFGIPWVWCKTKPELVGADFKFHDFMEGMRISARPAVVSPEEIDEAGLISLAKDAKLPDGEDIREMQRKLLCALRDSRILRPPRLMDERIRGFS